MSALPVPGESAATPLTPSLNATKWRARSLVALGHSPARLARALGTSRTTVNRILLGQDCDPGVILRQRIRHLWDSWWSLVPPERTAGERRREPGAPPGGGEQLALPGWSRRRAHRHRGRLPAALRVAAGHRHGRRGG